MKLRSKRTDDNKFYLSEMVDSNGNFLRIERPRSAAQRAGVTVQDGVTAGPNEVALVDTPVSSTNVTQEAPPVNTQNEGGVSLEQLVARFCY